MSSKKFLLCAISVLHCHLHFATMMDNVPLNMGTAAEYPGDLLIGGLFPIHQIGQKGECSTKIAMDGFFGLEAFLFSLDELNKHLNNTVGFTLGAVVFDTCSSERHALVKALKFVINDYLREETGGEYENDKRTLDVIGVVGPMKSSITIQVANLFGLFKMPQISYAATSPTLSNKEIYPYFMRTVPSDTNQAKALMEILKYMNISYIVGVYADSNYGTRGFREFEKLVEGTHICFAMKWKLETDKPLTMMYFRNMLRQIYTDFYQARAVVLYLHQDLAMLIFQAVLEENLLNHFIWIGPDGWANRFVSQELNSVVEGAIASLPVYKVIPGFEDYFFSLKPSTNHRNPWFSEFWSKVFNCSWNLNERGSTCDERKDLKKQIVGTEFGVMHFVRDAVHAYGNALISMHSKFCNKTKGICESLKSSLQNDDAQPLLHYLKNGTFKGVDGRNVAFLDGQDGLPIYTIANYQRKNDNGSEYKWADIATIYFGNETSKGTKYFLLNKQNQPRWIKTDQQLRFKIGTNFSFPKSVCGIPCPVGHVRRYKQDKCCWTCEPCTFPQFQHNETHCNYCITANDDHPPFKRPNVNRNGCDILNPIYIQLDSPFVCGVAALSVLGLLLVICAIVLFLHFSTTPIIKASGRELSIILLLGITLCYITVFIVVLKPTSYTCAVSRFLYSLGYTVSYAAIFIKTNRISRIFRHRNLRSSKKPKYVSPVSQIFIVLCLVGFQSILNTVWLILKPSTPVYLVELDYGDQYVDVHYFCEAFKDEDMIIALIFPICLLILSAVYAFKTRKIPGRFNETKFIIITTYTTCIVWLAFVPVFFSTEKIPLRIYSLCAALVLNATVTLICMFLPKLYLAVCRPHKNTKDNVMGRKSIVSLSGWNQSVSSKREDNNNINDIAARDGDKKIFEIESSVLLPTASNDSSVKSILIRRSL